MGKWRWSSVGEWMEIEKKSHAKTLTKGGMKLHEPESL